MKKHALFQGVLFLIPVIQDGSLTPLWIWAILLEMIKIT